MASFRCSVIIPTYNRSATVRRCLDHLMKQDIGAGELQVIVVDDGSSDDTVEVLGCLEPTFGDFVIQTQDNAGPGVARNNGLAVASAPIVLMMNDDTLLAPEAIAVHLDTHARFPDSMVLGTFDFVPEFATTALGQILSETPHLFSYPLFDDGDELGAELAATCNLSVPTGPAQAAGFDQRYTFAAEDVDFALSLQDAGLVLRHAAKAKAHHDHHLTVEDLKRTALLRGFGAARLALKRGVHDSVLADVRRTLLVETQTRLQLDAAVEALRTELQGSDPRGPFSADAYLALANIFRLGNLLGYLDEPAFIHEATRHAAMAS